ncbi:MAG TPA: methyltransferase domain-containing protein [Usitatibacter sp.]|nr:methyltransferase domain-containing protein [Usitatibacter sp.]
MNSPTFPRRDPADPGFWDLRYEARFAPWDAGRVPARLRAFVAGRAPAGKALVPGCGSARDVAFLAESGWDVLGLDFSAAALAAAQAAIGPHAARLRQGDFFAPIVEEPFALVYERAFLCALPRRLWPDWARRVAQLLRPASLLAGFFYFDAGDRGPPFPLHSQVELDALLGESFDRIEDSPVEDSIPVFEGKERWQVWKRRG